MGNKKTNKSSLNNTIGNIVISILWIILVCIIILCAIMWKKTSDFMIIISGVIGVIGVLFNIYLASKSKDRK
ncbi:MAG: hypothetical protein Q8936_10700 [Bacillota bacterium]|nr:hypothetical protein [Bacillota bacterium]